MAFAYAGSHAQSAGAPACMLVDQAAVKRISQILAADAPANPVEEIQRQNQDMLFQFGELQSRQDDLSRVNQKLQETNRGVVALCAELDDRADHLRGADELKSRFLSNMSHEFRTPFNLILALSRRRCAEAHDLADQFLLIPRNLSFVQTRLDGKVCPDADLLAFRITFFNRAMPLGNMRVL